MRSPSRPNNKSTSNLIHDLVREGSCMPTTSANVRKISGNTQGNNIAPLLRKREEGLGFRSSSEILGRIKKREVDQEEFNSAIKETRDKKNNACLNFPMRDLREITFRPAVIEANEANEANTTYNGSCFIGATFGEEADLSHLKFKYANFSHANLWDVNLSGTNLSDAYLRGADCRFANLTNADLSKADLSGTLFGQMTIFDETNLSNTNLSKTNLGYADLTGAKIDGAKFAGVIQASINSASDPKFSFNSKNILDLLECLDKTQLNQILGIGEEVPASEYLQNLINELRDGGKAKSRMQKVLDVVELLEKEIQSTTPSSDAETLRGVSRLSDRFSRMPEGR